MENLERRDFKTISLKIGIEKEKILEVGEIRIGEIRKNEE